MRPLYADSFPAIEQVQVGFLEREVRDTIDSYKKNPAEMVKYKANIIKSAERLNLFIKEYL